MSRGGAKSNQVGFKHIPWCRKQVVAKNLLGQKPRTVNYHLLMSPIYKQCKKSGQEPSEQQVI